MSTGPSRYLLDLEPGQQVLIKAGPFRGMQGMVTTFQRDSNDTELRVDVRLPASIRAPWGCGVAPVLFTNPTVDDLERT
jgi:hypothetical protein